jgi:hypothetical protein
MLAVVCRDAANDPLPCGGMGIPAGHREVDARVIHKLQGSAVERCDSVARLLARLLDARGVPIGGVERFFLRGSPRDVTIRDTVGTLTRRRR